MFPVPPHLPDDDPVQALRSSLTYARTVLEFVLNSPVYLIGASVVMLAFIGAVVRHWTGTALPLLADAVPMLIAIAGVVMSYKQPKRENHLVTTVVLVMFGLAGTAVMSWNRIRSERAHKIEMRNLQEKVNIVQNQNTDILARFVELGRVEPQSAEAKESERRQGVLQLLRNEYILSHVETSPGVLAGTEFPPSEWMNKRLRELGEKWTISKTVPPTPTTPTTQEDKASLVASFLPADVHNWPITEKTLSIENGMVNVSVNFMVKEHTAKGLIVWLRLCAVCSYGKEPQGLQVVNGRTVDSERMLKVGEAPPNAIYSPPINFAVIAPLYNRGFVVEIYYACDNCDPPDFDKPQTLTVLFDRSKPPS